jgi:hypothetical protein
MVFPFVQVAVLVLVFLPVQYCCSNTLFFHFFHRLLVHTTCYGSCKCTTSTHVRKCTPVPVLDGGASEQKCLRVVQVLFQNYSVVVSTEGSLSLIYFIEDLQISLE